MTKRFQNWLGQMSLSQQLLVVIILAILMFGLFFFVYLRINIQKAVTNQNYTMIERSQDQVIALYRQDPDSLILTDWGDADTAHYIILGGRARVVFGNYLSDSVPQAVYDLIYSRDPDDHNGTLIIQGREVFYRLKTIDPSTKILTLMSDSAGILLANELFNNVSNVAAFAVGAMFLLLIYWVTTLIHPLNQIKNYIDKVRSGEEASLKISRNDEIGEVATAVVSMREELKHQDEVKEEMIHNISHDLKTPIATIKSYAESIKDGIYPYGTLNKSVDVIIDNADRLDRKVHSLLFLNRLDYLLSSPERQMNSIDMNKIVEIVRMALSVIRPEIEISCSDELTVFRGEEESWRILVENLVDNALRYARHEVRIELRPGYLSVANDGPEISEEQMKKLFKPFEKGTQGKFGLGLSICSKVAEAYGYSIEARNLEGGAVFIVQDKTPIPEDKELKKKEKERETILKKHIQKTRSLARRKPRKRGIRL